MKRFEPKYLRCYCVAVAGAVAAVGTAAAGAYSANQQSKAAKQAANVGTPEDRYGRKVEPVPYNDRVVSDENYMNYMGEDVTDMVQGSLPDIFDIANKIDTQTRNVRKKNAPDFYSTMNQEGKNILEMEKGMVPSDVVASINRLVAQNLGGAVDPSAPSGGFAISATASDTARRLGLTSLDLMKTGMQLGQSWRSNVDSFLYTPEDAMKGIFFPGINAALGSAQLQMGRDQAEYVSDNNIERAEAMPNPQTTGQANDMLTMGALKAQSTQNYADAMVGLVNGGAQLYTTTRSALAPKPTTSTGGMITGDARRNAYGASAYRG